MKGKYERKIYLQSYVKNNSEMHKVYAICKGMGNNGIFEKRNLAFNFFFLENWVLRYLKIIFTGIGLHDRIMKTTEIRYSLQETAMSKASRIVNIKKADFQGCTYSIVW